MTIKLMAWLCIIGIAAHCANEPKKFPVISHRTHGVGDAQENNPQNALLALQELYGVEIDIRGDGRAAYTLGHLAPGDHTLSEVIYLINSHMDAATLSSKMLMLDIADDTNFSVTTRLVDDLIALVQGTPAQSLNYIVINSSGAGLERVFTSYQGKQNQIRMEFGMTYFGAATFTPPAIADYILLPVQELPDTPLPKRVIPYSANTRAEWRMVQNYAGDVAAIETDVPKRILEFQK